MAIKFSTVAAKTKEMVLGVVLDPEWKAAVVDVVRHNDRLMLVKVVQKEVITDQHNLCICSTTQLQSGREGSIYRRARDSG